MKGVVEQLRDEYDYIFIDCLPSLGLVTVNALTAADSVLIPVQCEIFSLEGLAKLKNTVNLVKKALNPKLEIEGLLLSMYDPRLRLANLVVDQVREHSKDYVFETIIHRSARLSEAPNVHKPIIAYDASSKGSVNFLNLCKEFLIRNKDTVQRASVVEA
jgi:chromosome partitioning protein